MSERFIPTPKQVYLATLTEAAAKYFQPSDEPLLRGSRTWFKVLEDFEETQKLAPDFQVDYKETIMAIVRAVPVGLRREYFATIAPILPASDVKEISETFRLGEMGV